MAIFQYFKIDNIYDFAFMGLGSLLSDRFVLTSSVIFLGVKSNDVFKITAGTHNLSGTAIQTSLAEFLYFSSSIIDDSVDKSIVILKARCTLNQTANLTWSNFSC